MVVAGAEPGELRGCGGVERGEPGQAAGGGGAAAEPAPVRPHQRGQDQPSQVGAKAQLSRVSQILIECLKIVHFELLLQFSLSSVALEAEVKFKINYNLHFSGSK